MAKCPLFFPQGLHGPFYAWYSRDLVLVGSMTLFDCYGFPAGVRTRLMMMVELVDSLVRD